MNKTKLNITYEVDLVTPKIGKQIFTKLQEIMQTAKITDWKFGGTTYESIIKNMTLEFFQGPISCSIQAEREISVTKTNTNFIRLTPEEFEEIKDGVTYAFSAGSIGNKALRARMRKTLNLIYKIEK